MSQKLIITLAAAATITAASFAPSTSYARGFGFGGGGHMSTFGGGGHMSMHAGGFGAMGHSGSFRTIRTGHSTLHTIRSVRTSRPGRPILIGHLHHLHHHHHWALRGGRWIEIDEADGIVAEAPVEVAPAVVAPGPCTCLTKTYTPTGLVVFADVCTKESASAPALDDAADASTVPTSPVAATATPISQVPTAPNYAGRSYADYLAANPQGAQGQAAAQPSPQGPKSSQQN